MKTSCLPEANYLLEETPLVSTPCQGTFCSIWQSRSVSMYQFRHRPLLPTCRPKYYIRRICGICDFAIQKKKK